MGRSRPFSDSLHMVSSPLHSLAVRLVRTSISNKESIRKTASTSAPHNTTIDHFDDALVHKSDSEYLASTMSKDDLHATFRTPPLPAREPMRKAQSLGSTIESPTPLSSSSGKSVVFGDIRTRSYNLVLGDHPCCSMGCPLSLGWEYQQSPDVSLDEYEATRCPRRTKTELLTTWEERRDMLADVPDDEVKRAQRKFHRERCNQRKVQTRVCAAFFQQGRPGDALMAGASSCT